VKNSGKSRNIVKSVRESKQMDRVKTAQNAFGIGSEAMFTRRITENDINLFAELTGDFSPNHVDEEYMRNSIYGKRIAHGALLVGFMSNASSMIIENYFTDQNFGTPVSLGYDRIRFIKPVFIDDTITVRYTVDAFDQQLKRSQAAIQITNQDDELVAVATHILKWVPEKSE
jgi:acyl dehydratase